MWLSRARYEALVHAEARTLAAEGRAVWLHRQLVEAQERAERAVDAMLLVRQLPTLAPPAPPPPAFAMFDDDPEVLAEWKKGGYNSPLDGLLEAAGEGPRE